MRAVARGGSRVGKPNGNSAREYLKHKVNTHARPPIVDETYTLACQMAIHSQQHVCDTLYHATALCQLATTFVTADDRYYRRAESFGRIVRLKEFSPG